MARYVPTTDASRQLEEFFRTVTDRLTEIERVIVAGSKAQIGTYTPTLAGMAIGTGGAATNTATYAYRDGWLHIEGVVRFGTAGTTFPGGTITGSLPPGWTWGDTTFMNGLRNAGDGIAINNTASQSGMMLIAMQSSTTFRFTASNATTTYTTRSATGAAIPITWDAGSMILWKVSALATPP